MISVAVVSRYIFTLVFFELKIYGRSIFQFQVICNKEFWHLSLDRPKHLQFRTSLLLLFFFFFNLDSLVMDRDP